MRLHVIAMLGIAAQITACGRAAQETPSATQYVMGTDDRQLVNNALYPWSAIGRLKSTFLNGSTGYCTATMVSANVAITAAHCLFSDGVPAAKLEFLPQYSRGQHGVVGTVVNRKFGSPFPQWAYVNDWALVKLDKDVGSATGWLGIYGLAAKDLAYPTTVDLAGYSSDLEGGEALSAHTGCKLLKRFASGDRGVDAPMVDTISHDCDMEKGSSGGPVISWYQGKPYVIAVQSYQGTNSTGMINAAVATDKASAAFGSL